MQWILSFLLPDYKSTFVGNKQPAELSPFYALKHFPGIVSPFTEALQEMARSEADLISIEAEQEARRVSQLEKIIQLLPAPCNALHVLQISGTYPKLSVAAKDYVQLMTQEQKEFYQTNIVCESLSDLCVATMGQSSCLRYGNISDRGHCCSLHVFFILLILGMLTLI